MTPQELIEFHVPLLAHERGHQWRKVELHGCDLCGHHDGFECVNCHRVIDAQTDVFLYEAVAEVGYLPEESDEDNP